MQVLASQLHFLANRIAELAVPPLFWPVNCIKIGGHVALLSCPSIYFLFYARVTELLALPGNSPSIENYRFPGEMFQTGNKTGNSPWRVPGGKRRDLAQAR